MMDWELRDVLYLANIGTNVVLWILFARERRRDKAVERFGAVDKAIGALRQELDKGRVRATSDLAHLRNDMEGRLSALESTVSRSPTHEDLGSLHEKINEVAEAVAELRGEFRGVRNTLETIHDNLMRRGV